MRNEIVLFFAAVFLACAACSTEQASKQGPANSNSNRVETPSSPAAPVDLVAQGRKIFNDNCSACHKEDGTGGKITIEGKTIDPEDLTSGKIKKLADDKIYVYIYKGLEDDGMPSFKDKLSEAEIREVVTYLRSEIQKMPQATVKKPLSQ